MTALDEGGNATHDASATIDVRPGDNPLVSLALTPTLVLSTRWGNDRTVRPAFGDTFFGDYLLSFTRGRRGEVGGC